MPNTLFGGLMLALIDMSIVFAVLISIALVIRVTSFAINGLAAGKGNGGDGFSSGRNGENEDVADESFVASGETTNANEPSPGILAAIAAAINVYCEEPALGRIAVMFTGDDASPWALAGRQRLMNVRTSLVGR